MSLNQSYTTATATATPTIAQKTTTPVATISTAGWKTYTNSTYGFSFKYPNGINLVNSTSKSDDTKTNLWIDASNIETVAEADGACGSSSPALYQQQKTAFDPIKNNTNFDQEFDLTSAMTEYSTVKTMTNNVKFAYGQDLCRGIVQDSDTTSYSFIALTFNQNTRATLRMTLSGKQSDNITVKDLETNSEKISNGTYKGQAQQSYDNFVKILSTFKFTS